jgi:hypothetical protein
MPKGINQQPDSTLDAGALALIAMPFTFIQDELLDASRFIDAARERGYRLTLDDLQDLHNNRLQVASWSNCPTLVERRLGIRCMIVSVVPTARIPWS